jgi:hypothetical protein
MFKYLEMKVFNYLKKYKNITNGDVIIMTSMNYYYYYYYFQFCGVIQMMIINKKI